MQCTNYKVLQRTFSFSGRNNVGYYDESLLKKAKQYESVICFKVVVLLLKTTDDISISYLILSRGEG